MNANERKEREFVIRFDSDPPSYYDGSHGDPGRTTILALARVYRCPMSASRAKSQLWSRYRRAMQLVTVASQQVTAP